MKKICYGLLSFLFIGLASCAKEDARSSLEGRIDVRVSTDQSLADAESRASEDVAPEINDFALAIESADGKISNSWDSFGKFQPVSVPVGTYLVTASYGDANAEGFDALSYLGSTTVEVGKDETAEASVTCTINKARVVLSYTDDFKSYFSSYSAYVSSSKGNKITYAADETRGAYFVPGNLELFLEVTRQGVSQKVTLNPKNFTAEVKHEYRLTMDVDASTASLKIVFNDNPSSEQNVDINISDEALNAPAPEFTAYGFTSGNAIEVVEGSTVSNKLEAYLNAASGLVKCELITVSEALKAQGWPESVDLMNLTTEQSQKMTELGLNTKGLGANHDKIALVDFKNVLPHLYCTSDGNDVHTFTLRATDVLTKVSEDLVLKVTTRNNGFAVTLPEYVSYGSTTMTADLTLEGDPALIKFYYIYLGVYQEFTADKIDIQPGTEENKYKVTFTYPEPLVDTENGVKFKAQYGAKTIEGTFKVEDPELTLSLKNGDADVWAKHADFQIVASAKAKSRVSRTISTSTIELQYEESENVWKKWDNVTFDGANGFTVNGLTSGTSYKFRAVYCQDVYSNEFSITTEDELSVPNSGMEDWYYTRPSGVEHWEVWYACKEGEQPVWSTMNQLTTSEGGTTTFNGFNYGKFNAYRYNANSGTLMTTEGKNGNAAQIRAVGWGQGNQANSSANAKYATVGELYIGHYDSETKTAVYDGIEFTSRPKSLTFDYKYTPGKGGDQYYAEIVIQNKQADTVTEIGRGLSRNGNSVGEWTPVTIDIEYTEAGKKMKATHMYIVFKSGDNAGNDYFNTVPSFGNLSDGQYVGSEFFVDNIVLNYE